MLNLDANAQSRLRPEVSKKIVDLLSNNWRVANPSSVHQYGQWAQGLREEARRQVKQSLDLKTANVVFTSGGTEACNAALRGFIPPRNLSSKGKPAHILSTAIEHPSVLEVLADFEKMDYKVSLIPPAKDGIVRTEEFLCELQEETILVCMMYANNETGALQPVLETAIALQEKGSQAAFFVDAVQALGKTHFIPQALFDAGVTAIALSSHKLGGLAGAGALILSENSHRCYQFQPLLLGGSQEKNFRAGTEPLIPIIGFGEAVISSIRELSARIPLFYSAIEKFFQELEGKVDFVVISPSSIDRRLANTIMVRFPGLIARDLVVALDLAGIACSAGAACSSGKQRTSYVVTHMGYEKEKAMECVRFSFDWDIELEDARKAGQIVQKVISKGTVF